MVHRMQQRYLDDYDDYYYYESTRASSLSPHRRPSKSKSNAPTTKATRQKKRSNSISGEERIRRRSNSINNGGASSSRNNSINNRRRVKNNNDRQYEDYYYYNRDNAQGRIPWEGEGGIIGDETWGEIGPMFDSHGFHNDDYMYHNDMMTPWPHGPIAPGEYGVNNEYNNNNEVDDHHVSFSFRPRRKSSTNSTKKKKRSSSISSQQTVVDNNNGPIKNHTIYISDQPFDDTAYIPQRRNTIQGGSSSSTAFHNLPQSMPQEQPQLDNHQSHTIRRRHSLYEQPSASMLMSPMLHEQESSVPMTTPSSPWIPSKAFPQSIHNNSSHVNQLSMMPQAPLQQQLPMAPPMMPRQQPMIPPIGGGPMIPPMNQFSAIPMIPRPTMMMPQPGMGMPMPPFPHQPMMPPMLPGLGGPLGLPPPPLPGLGGPLPPPMPPGPLDPSLGGPPGPISVVPPTVAPTAAATRAVSPVAKKEESKPKTKEVASKPKEDPKPRSKSPVKKEEPKSDKPKEEEAPKAETKGIPATTAAAAVAGAAAAVVAAAVEKAKESPKAAVAEIKKEIEEIKEDVAKEIKEEPIIGSATTPPKAEPTLRRSRSLFGGWLGGGGGGGGGGKAIRKQEHIPIYHLSRWDPASVMPIQEAVKPPKISSMAMNARGIPQPVYPRGHPLNQYLPKLPEPTPETRHHKLSRSESTRVMAKAEELGMRQYIWCYRPMDPVSAENPTVVWGAFDMRNQYKLERFIPHVIHKHPIDPNASVTLYSQKDLPGRTVVKPMMEIGYNFRRTMSSKALVLEVVCFPNTDPGKLMVRHPKAKDEKMDTAPGLSFARANPGIAERLRRSIF